ncbi:YqaJ viral recombinase family protein [Variovorax paradoxus]|nr:YqaJ viral recombinase family protein [Variovorax paradoxus]MBT2299221.1 YqaJ viral recombinase family protein [Variovorax paradoxus]
MKQHSFAQGSPEWHAHRATHFNASDAPAMMGCSPYKTRNQLLHEIHTGVTPTVDAATQRRFDDGHRFEALARPLAEEIIGEDLYPVTGSVGKLSASFDGLPIAEDVPFEHKSLNDELRAAMPLPGLNEGVTLPLQYRIQMEQQCMVCGADRVLFMASKWNGDELVEERHCWYESSQHLADDIAAGWDQFEHDLPAYVPAEPVADVVGRTPETLPALRIEVTGMVTASNLVQYREHALAVFAGINRDLKTDQDFANADKTVKWCGEVESRLAAAKQHALSQTESIDVLFKTIDDITAEARATRLELDKLVKARKEARRGEIVAGGVKALADHIAALTTRLGKPYMPAVPADFGGAIKGLRTFDSMQNAVDTALANAKITASAAADRIQANLTTLREKAAEHAFLFPDTAQIVQKAPDDLATLVTARIAEHEEKERVRKEAERERIRNEERQRLEREQEAERQRAAQEQAAAAVPAAAPAQPHVAVAAPAATPAPAPTVIPMPARTAAAPTSKPTLSLGQIKERITPLQITAEGMATLGFTGVKDRGSVLFHEAEYPHVLAAIVAHVQAIQAKQAA